MTGFNVMEQRDAQAVKCSVGLAKEANGLGVTGRNHELRWLLGR